MFPEWQHKFTATKPYQSKEYGGSRMIKVEAGLHHIGGNPLPFFSVTGEIYRPKASDCDACGQLHTEVLKHWPELAPVVALHLSDSDGVPMHSVANGWYWLAGYYGGLSERYHGGNSGDGRSPEECLRIFAEHVRVPLKEARTLAEGWRADDLPEAMCRWFTQWAEAQRPRWKAEAEAACTLLDSLAAAHV